MNGKEAVAQVAAEAREAGWPRPDDWDNIVGYYAHVTALFETACDLCLVAEFAWTDVEARRAARRWSWRLAKALRDLGKPDALDRWTAGVEKRQHRAQEQAARVWDAVAKWDAAALEAEMERVVIEVRFNSALLGASGPTYRRAGKLVGVTGVLLAHCGPGRAGASRTRDGIARAVRGEGSTSLVGDVASEREGERTREEEEVVTPRTSRRTRATGGTRSEQGDVGGYVSEEDGWA